MTRRSVVLIGPFGLKPKTTTSRRALPLGRALARAGLRVTLLVPPYDDPAAASTTFEDAGVCVEQLAGSLPALGIRLARRALALRPDVVHVFKPTGPAGMAAALLTGRVPVVQDCDDWEGRGGWADADPHLPPTRWLIGAQDRWIPRLARQATAASRTLVRRLERQGVPVTYLPNCADPSWAMRPRPHGSRVQAFRRAHGIDAPLVLCLGNVQVENDLDLAAAALAPIADRIRWGIIGDGPGLAPLLARLPPALAGRTIPLGRLFDDDLAPALAAATCVLVPVRDTLINRAKCAMKVIDTLAAGTPVVAPDVGQHREYIVHGETGLLSTPGDTAGLTALVRLLVDTPDLSRRLGRAARTRIRNRYTWDAWLPAVEAAYGMVSSQFPVPSSQ